MGGGGRFDSAGARLENVQLTAAIAALKNAVASFFADPDADEKENKDNGK